MQKERHVLVIFPHPDDESFGTAGVIQQYRENQIPVTYLCMTLGEMGRNLGNPPLATRESLPELRRKELKDAAEILDMKVIHMGLRDKTIEFLDENLLAEEVLQVIRKINPSTIISFYPPYAVHPDHNACGEIVIRAVKKMKKNERPKLHLVAFSDNCVEKIGEPDIVININEQAKTKLAAIRAHRSQTEIMTKGWEKLLETNDKTLKNRFFQERYWVYQIED